MKKISTAMLICVALLSVSFTKLSAQTDQEQRIHASYVLSFGRDATPAEVTYWKGQGNLSIATLLTRNQQFLKQDAATRNATIERAYQDAIGRHATAAEISYWSPSSPTYITLMKNNMSWLQGNPAEYEKTITNAFLVALNRKPTADQLKSWKNSPHKFSNAMLIAYLQGNKNSYSIQCTPAENAQSLSLANNTPAILRIPVSAMIGSEAMSSAGLVASGGGNLVASGGGNLVASGGGNLVASGGGNLVASGGGN